jgi:SNF2 family DNA or RNA helicase
VGLTLTAANKVYFMDLAFNPQVMAQAIDRTHRIGQERKVVVKQLVVSGTVEEKMLKLLQRKREIADVALSPPQITMDQVIYLLGG